MMDHLSLRGLQQFKEYVGIKFQLYNSLFTSLPFHRIEKTGILLSLLLNHCEESYKKKLGPIQIIDDFFRQYTSITEEREKVDLLFRFVQYVERQVVLFDALEDAAFREITDVNGVGSLKHLESEVMQQNKEAEFSEKLSNFAIRLVLTAHPTQFYPGTVLGIINDLSRAVKENNASQINMYLQQLGKTPFFKKQKPTPYDEAVSLLWYLENVFYYAAGRIMTFLRSQFPQLEKDQNPLITMGFWPGGDRDGNPNVTAEISLKVADALRSGIIKCYYLDVRRLKRRLTFKGVETILADLETKLYNHLFIPDQRLELKPEEISDPLYKVREIIVYQHNGLFLSLVDNLISKIQVFGLHFASLDIRQDSSVHNNVLETIAAKEKLLPSNYDTLNEDQRIEALINASGNVKASSYDGLIKDTIESFHVIKTIQQFNGEQGCSRYIISHSETALNVIEVYGLFLLTGWTKENLTVDIVPLFETIEDLKRAPSIMKSLYENTDYYKHLSRRGNKQTIMVGFSDGTKDGGYFMANWSIYKAKEELTKISRAYQIDVVFFDGRGGPPARGGGKTHKFYASMRNNISNKEIQLTIQGQTVSSNFGTIDSAQYSIEQLLNAGISNDLFYKKEKTLEEKQEGLLQKLADISYDSYKELKNHPDFLSYLEHVSPLNLYSETNIGSRPSKRGKSSRLELKDLRAIPFVGAWTQLKQNVPGYYGVGTALQALDKEGKLNELKSLYEQSLYFKTLMDNCEMAMKKSFFPLTAYLSTDKTYGEIWNMIYSEYELTQKYIFILTGKNELMADYPVEQLSVQMRERIVLPLTTIQQYAINKIREVSPNPEQATIKESLQRLVVRCSFGIINAGRNSV
jgi:phosphoenolpyruvate carboxylase